MAAPAPSFPGTTALPAWGRGLVDSVRGSSTARLAGRIPDAPLMVVLAVALALVSWPLDTLDPGAGLDSSWETGLHMAVHEKLNFGTQAVFTYGPLGFLRANAGYAFPWTTRWAFVYVAGVQFALCLTLLWAVRRQVRTLWIAVPMTLLAASLTAQEPVLIIVFVLAMALVRDELPVRMRGPLLLALGLLVGINVLAKVNVGGTSLAVCVIAVWAHGERRRRPDAFLFGGAALAIVSGWVLTGQAVSAIPDFMTGAIQVASGYSQAMGIQQFDAQWELWAAGAIAIIGLTVITRTSTERRARFGLVAMWLILWYSVFKAGFVRQDPGHANIFWATMLGALLGFPLRRLPPSTAALVVLFAATTALASSQIPPTHLIRPWDRADNALTEARSLSSGQRLNRKIVTARANIRLQEGVPPGLIAALRGHRVHIDPYDANVAWAYQLDWRPVPVFQSYQAYTADLDQRNADAFADAGDGPDRVLRHLAPAVDGRAPAWESPAAVRSMFCHFRATRTQGPWQVLARTANRCGVARRIGEVKVGYGEPIQVPAAPNAHSFVYVELKGAQLSLRERLETLALRSPERYVVLDGGPARVRLVPATSDRGLLVRVPPAIEYPTPLRIGPAIRSFAVTSSNGHTGDVTARFYAVPVRR